MKRLARVGLIVAAAAALAACSMFDHSQAASSPQPQASKYYDNDLHGGYPGPGTSANRE